MNLEHKWIYKDSEYAWAEHQYKILYPYLFRFEIMTRRNIIDAGKVILKGHELIILKDLINELIRSFIQLHVSPTHKQLSKYGSSFERINFEGRDYIINYRQTDPIGFIIFSMYSFLSVIENAIEKDEIILLAV